MFGSSGFFCFHYSTDHVPDSARIAFAYKPPNRLRSGAIEDLIALMCRGPHVPDAAVIFSLKGDLDDVGGQLERGATRIARGRMNPRTTLYHVEFDCAACSVDVILCGDLSTPNAQDFSAEIRDSFKEWMRAGLESLFRPEVIVLRPPPGYTYQKPSGSNSAVFLKPDLALDTSAANSFVALCVFAKAFVHRHYVDDLETVFVDTMAIASVAYELSEILVFAGKKKAPQIESFHSYGGMAQVARPLPWTSLCIISASTSMAMLGEWVTSKKVSAGEAVTLVTCDTAHAYRDRALVSIGFGHAQAEPVQQRSIHIRGETFLPEPEAPKQVLIGISHKCAEDVRKLQELAGTGIIDIYRRSSASTSRTRGVYVDGDLLVNHSSFQEWARQQVFDFAKISTRFIVHQDDESSKSFASLLAGELKSKFSKELDVFSAASLDGTAVVHEAGVIVCAAVVGKGSQLLDVSRQLRKFHKGPRLYLVGFQVAEQSADIRLLASNLTQTRDESYQFRAYSAIAIGAQLVRSFEAEVGQFYPASLVETSIPQELKARADVLGTDKVVGRRALLPGPTSNSAMRLRPGFVFWNKSFSGEKDYQAETIATMAVVLQKARDNPGLDEDRRLSSAAFRHVMLSPENFSRFNDGLLQAALLRCAYPSEIDYRGDSASSEFLKSLVLKSFARIGTDSGEAALEFLVAIADGRLKLGDLHHKKIIEAARKIADANGPLSLEFRFLTGSPSSAEVSPI